LRKGERVELSRDRLLAWARSLRPDDEVVLEATGNTVAIVRPVTPHVGRVVIANPVQVRAMARARAKTDQIDASTPGQAHANGLLPEVWVNIAQILIAHEYARPIESLSPCFARKEVAIPCPAICREISSFGSQVRRCSFERSFVNQKARRGRDDGQRKPCVTFDRLLTAELIGR
jgi:hypothetical protein